MNNFNGFASGNDSIEFASRQQTTVIESLWPVDPHYHSSLVGFQIEEVENQLCVVWVDDACQESDKFLVG